MIFLSNIPNLYVKISNKYIRRVTGKKGLYFDANGEYEIPDDHPLVGLMKSSFSYKEAEKPARLPDGQAGQEYKLKCSKCDYKTNNHGELMAHHRLQHPKGASRLDRS